MAYRLYIPAKPTKDVVQRNALLDQLKRANSDTVFLIFDRYLTDEDALNRGIEVFIDNKRFFEQNGINVCAWLVPTIGYGGFSPCDGNAPNVYTHIVADDGYECPGAYCPLDKNFVDDFLRTLCALAKTGVQQIMFEDDFTLGGGKFSVYNVGCLCELHRKKLVEYTGEDLSLEEIKQRLHGGKPNEYRSRFLDLQRDTLLDFAKRIEKAVHEINPSIRLGLSANASSYQIEGATFAELVKATAGNTKPFARMTGAPYWNSGPSLAANIEAIRLQCHWLEETGAELITEGDVYPRPRHIVPANYLEGYDMALRASGGSDGILKYMIDYFSRPSYETGYIDRHIKNQQHYLEIEKRFNAKNSAGLNVVAYPSLFRIQDYSVDVTSNSVHSCGFLPLTSQWFLTDNSIPITYGQIGKTPSLIFGDEARLFDLDALNAGAILDGTAARILFERGVDVGFNSYQIKPALNVEHYLDYQDYTVTNLGPDAKVYDFKLKQGAQVLSEYPAINGTPLSGVSPEALKTAPKTCGTYRYENKLGQRFVVFPFVAETTWGASYIKGNFKCYYRQRQLVEGFNYVAKKPLPAVCTGNPFLYIIAKKDEDNMSVGLWNFFADEVINPVIQLDEPYDNLDVYLKGGKLDGDKVILDQDIPPYGFVLFTVSKKRK